MANYLISFNLLNIFLYSEFDYYSNTSPLRQYSLSNLKSKIDQIQSLKMILPNTYILGKYKNTHYKVPKNDPVIDYLWRYIVSYYNKENIQEENKKLIEILHKYNGKLAISPLYDISMDFYAAILRYNKRLITKQLEGFSIPYTSSILDSDQFTYYFISNSPNLSHLVEFLLNPQILHYNCGEVYYKLQKSIIDMIYLLSHDDIYKDSILSYIIYKLWENENNNNLETMTSYIEEYNSNEMNKNKLFLMYTILLRLLHGWLISNYESITYNDCIFIIKTLKRVLSTSSSVVTSHYLKEYNSVCKMVLKITCIISQIKGDNSNFLDDYNIINELINILNTKIYKFQLDYSNKRSMIVEVSNTDHNSYNTTNISFKPLYQCDIISSLIVLHNISCLKDMIKNFNFNKIADLIQVIFCHIIDKYLDVSTIDERENLENVSQRKNQLMKLLNNSEIEYISNKLIQILMGEELNENCIIALIKFLIYNDKEKQVKWENIKILISKLNIKLQISMISYWVQKMSMIIGTKKKVSIDIKEAQKEMTEYFETIKNDLNGIVNTLLELDKFEIKANIYKYFDILHICDILLASCLKFMNCSELTEKKQLYTEFWNIFEYCITLAGSICPVIANKNDIESGGIAIISNKYQGSELDIENERRINHIDINVIKSLTKNLDVAIKKINDKLISNQKNSDNFPSVKFYFEILKTIHNLSILERNLCKVNYLSQCNNKEKDYIGFLLDGLYPFNIPETTLQYDKILFSIPRLLNIKEPFDTCSEQHFCLGSDRFNIIFIHGLNGSAFKSWKIQSIEYSENYNEIFRAPVSLEDYSIWPRLLLGYPFSSKIGILAFDYSTELFNSTLFSLPSSSKKVDKNLEYISENLYLKLCKANILEQNESGIADISNSKNLKSESNNPFPKNKNRKIIFICHSMGGLLLKLMLLNHPNIIKSTYAIFFFGTPHFGSDVGYRSLYIMKPFISQFTLQLSSHHSQKYLLELNNLFQSTLYSIPSDERPKVFSFSEYLPSKLPLINTNKVVVPPNTANPSIGNFYVLGTNHTNIARLCLDINDTRLLILYKLLYDREK
ncbi:uncharacterized protein CMU_031620 [Cryptosporidium muris RN66]|uniref:Uncharacterized protein n=1 Tax=Cryptosporidium muris (strain RN66) TaxID=441375 RepID=B6AII0_CRYMR|nr:uncharacterized protein CMU_031620 [Cryptosporidium muris RN66]EEA08021.1 hypothetical protein, conserved [Cryptosporidium muris RN66]|eukprot:XP_002142370.1 hypothetical protein [Cryptosporidium muris RN66]